MHNEAMKMAKHAMTDACAKGYDCMTSQDWDDLKDCVETAKNAIECDYYYRLVERMNKDEEEGKREDAYFLDMLKEEYKDDYKRMKDEYGDEEGERRFYDNYRHANGRFARKGTGMYEPRNSGRRRGYEEPPYWHMMPYDYADDYDYTDAERMRDMDRTKGKLYFSEPMRSRDMGDGYPSRMGGDMGGNSRMRDSKEGRSWNSRRTYMEAKEMNRGNTPEEKRQKMSELEKYMGELGTDISEMIIDASPEEKNLLKQKLQVLTQKIN